MTKRLGIRRRWTERQIRILCLEYPDHPTAQIARRVGHSLSSTYQYALRRGLRKSPAYLANDASGRFNRLNRLNAAGRAHRFTKGQAPWNKGMKGLQMGRATQFKPGHKPQTWLPVGSERVTKDGIRQRKVSDTGSARHDWRAIHVLMWEAENGPLPRGHIVVFKDHNHEHMALENFELVTRQELMRRNSYHTRYPKELARLIQLKGALQRQINKRDNSAKQD